MSYYTCVQSWLRFHPLCHLLYDLCIPAQTSVPQTPSPAHGGQSCQHHRVLLETENGQFSFFFKKIASVTVHVILGLIKQYFTFFIDQSTTTGAQALSEGHPFAISIKLHQTYKMV